MILRAEPGEIVMVKGPQHDPNVEKAVADKDGVVRDAQGRSYSSGSYEILS